MNVFLVQCVEFTQCDQHHCDYVVADGISICTRCVVHCNAGLIAKPDINVVDANPDANNIAQCRKRTFNSVGNFCRAPNYEYGAIPRYFSA